LHDLVLCCRDSATTGSPSGVVHELLDAIVAAPDDVDHYLVYADWLQSQGDPRGELIALQHASDTGDDPEVRRRADAVFRRHRDVFLGTELAAAVDHARDRHGSYRQGLELGWRRGFIARAWLGRMPNAEMREARTVLDALLAHPSARVLRELVLDVPIWGRWVNFDQLYNALVDTPVAPPLRRLQIGDFVERHARHAPYPDRDISAVELADLSQLWPRYPRLEAIELQGCHLILGTIDSPALRSFELCSSTADDTHLAALRAPNLERLVLWLGDGEYGGTVTRDGIADLIARAPTSLRELGIMNTPLADEAAELLSRSPLARQLRVLDLSLGTLTNEGARFIERRAFPALEELRLHRNYVGGSAIAKLRAWCPTVGAEDQRDPDSQRYVSVSE
jgi:uncharacterized protein (TIGR02996 family)